MKLIADKNSRRSKGIAYVEFVEEGSVQLVCGEGGVVWGRGDQVVCVCVPCMHLCVRTYTYVCAHLCIVCMYMYIHVRVQ